MQSQEHLCQTTVCWLLDEIQMPFLHILKQCFFGNCFYDCSCTYLWPFSGTVSFGSTFSSSRRRRFTKNAKFERIGTAVASSSSVRSFFIHFCHHQSALKVDLLPASQCESGRRHQPLFCEHRPLSEHNINAKRSN